jgi:transcriptional regulator with XRE-family HTH domain
VNSIGERIKAYRLKKRITLRDFAKLIGISQGGLSEIENNKTKPGANTLISIVHKNDINPGWLLTGEGDMFIKPLCRETEISSEVLEALKSNPTIEKIIMMLGEMKDDDVLHLFSMLEERKKVRDLEDQITEIKKKLDKKKATG